MGKGCFACKIKNFLINLLYALCKFFGCHPFLLGRGFCDTVKAYFQPVCVVLKFRLVGIRKIRQIIGIQFSENI